MAILLDTHVLVWIGVGDDRLGRNAATVIGSGTETLLVSAVTALEFVELNRRGRFQYDLPLAPLLDRLDAMVVDYPADAWRFAEILPDIHRDPVDRMLVAHALRDGLSIVTADATIRRYPVTTIW